MAQQGSTQYLYAFDGNGNVSAVMNRSSGTTVAEYEYGAFGETIRASDTFAQTNPFRFSTKYTDNETGLLYYGYRYYAPTIGRFLGRDPSGEKGGLHLYRFVNNNPVNAWDNLGMGPQSQIVTREPDQETPPVKVEKPDAQGNATLHPLVNVTQDDGYCGSDDGSEGNNDDPWADWNAAWSDTLAATDQQATNAAVGNPPVFNNSSVNFNVSTTLLGSISGSNSDFGGGLSLSGGGSDNLTFDSSGNSYFSNSFSTSLIVGNGGYSGGVISTDANQVASTGGTTALVVSNVTSSDGTTTTNSPTVAAQPGASAPPASNGSTPSNTTAAPNTAGVNGSTLLAAGMVTTVPGILPTSTGGILSTIGQALAGAGRWVLSAVDTTVLGPLGAILMLTPTTMGNGELPRPTFDQTTLTLPTSVNASQDKLLSNGEIQKLIDAGYHPHDLKPGAGYDLYKDPTGNVLVKPKGGIGPGEPTGININNPNGGG